MMRLSDEPRILPDPSVVILVKQLLLNLSRA
jgi:hypothetical protein